MMSGIIDTVAELAPSHPMNEQLRQAYKNLTGTVASYQASEGHWGWAVSAPRARRDTSGTAIIAYSIERAIGIGWLDLSWGRVSEAALRSIVRSTSDDGSVNHALSDVMDIGLYPPTFRIAAWAQGPTVALATLVMNRLASAHQ